MSDDKDQAGAHVLYWSGKLFSAQDLRRHLTNQRELVVLPRTLVTPLAVDELRARGVGIRRQEKTATTEDQAAGANTRQGWAYVQETPDPVVGAAAAALEREGLAVTALHPAGSSFVNWLRSARERLDQYAGSVIFCVDAALMCCLANKITGLRAAAVANARQAGRALATLGANVLVVEMPGRTFFEVRQILRTAAGASAPVCPPDIAKLLLEAEGHAHR